MNRQFFQHLLLLARQACPGCNHYGAELGDIIVQGYSRELREDLKALYRMWPIQPTLAICLLIEAYIRHYEGYLHYWLLLQSLQAAKSRMRIIPMDADQYGERINNIFQQWRSWRLISLYQLKKYCLFHIDNIPTEGNDMPPHDTKEISEYQ